MSGNNILDRKLRDSEGSTLRELLDTHLTSEVEVNQVARYILKGDV